MPRYPQRRTVDASLFGVLVAAAAAGYFPNANAAPECSLVSLSPTWSQPRPKGDSLRPTLHRSAATASADSEQAWHRNLRRSRARARARLHRPDRSATTAVAQSAAALLSAHHRSAAPMAPQQSRRQQNGGYKKSKFLPYCLCSRPECKEWRFAHKLSRESLR